MYTEMLITWRNPRVNPLASKYPAELDLYVRFITDLSAFFFFKNNEAYKWDIKKSKQYTSTKAGAERGEGPRGEEWGPCPPGVTVGDGQQGPPTQLLPGGMLQRGPEPEQ